MDKNRATTVTIIGTVCIAVLGCWALSGSAANSTLPPSRKAMSDYLLQPADWWETYYDVVPVGERRLYWTTKTLMDVMVQQQSQIRTLQAQVKALQETMAEPPSNEAGDPNET